MTLLTFEMWSGLTGRSRTKASLERSITFAPARQPAWRTLFKCFSPISTTKVTIEVEEARVRPDDVPHICGDRKKIQELTGWCPKISLHEMVASLIDYWRSRVASRRAT